MICLHFLACPVSQSSPIESPHYDIIPKENWEIEQLWEIDNNEEQENLISALYIALYLPVCQFLCGCYKVKCLHSMDKEWK